MTIWVGYVILRVVKLLQKNDSEIIKKYGYQNNNK